MRYVLTFVLLFSSLTASAGLLIEPLVGYNVITKFDGESGSGGGAYGGRLGYQNFGFQLGLDYLSSTIALDSDDTDDDFKTSEFGAFVGYEFPVFFRLYAGYVFSASSNTIEVADEDGGPDNEATYLDGSGAKFGIGFTGLPFVAINFEMRSIQFDTTEVKDGGSGIETEIDDGVKLAAYLISLSIPIDI